MALPSATVLVSTTSRCWNDPPKPPPPAVGGEALATLNFSGGTTGAPKAVMLRHRNLMTVAQNTIRAFGIDDDAVFLNVRPLWPIAQVILMSHLFAGATVALGGRGDPDRLAALIDETGATRTSLVPTQLVRWIDHLSGRDAGLSHLEAIYVGGSRISAPGVRGRARPARAAALVCSTASPRRRSDQLSDAAKPCAERVAAQRG